MKIETMKKCIDITTKSCTILSYTQKKMSPLSPTKNSDANDIPFGTIWWFIYAGFSCLLDTFASIMPGLTLGGSSTKKKAAAIFPVLPKKKSSNRAKKILP